MNRGFPGCACIFILGLLTGCASSPNQAISVCVSPQPAFVGSAQSIQLAATVTGDSSGVMWSVNGVAGGNSTVGAIDSNGNFTAPAVVQNSTATVTAAVKDNPADLASATVSIVAPGTVASTNNPQVALYTITPPADANVSIEFGPGANYSLTTWTQPTPSGGGPISIYVAGMRANTLYHMRAVIEFSGSSTVEDSDHTFTTSSLPAAELPTVTASSIGGMAPQPGVELLDLVDAAPTSQVGVAVTDLAGNLLWGYSPNLPSEGPAPIKLMPNGHFLINYYDAAAEDGTNSVMQEVDLGGNVVWSMTTGQLNQALANATCVGCNVTVVGTHHDFALLPNGHIIVIAAEDKVESGLTGYSSPVTVTGDVLIDLDQNRKPVWIWSEFDHLDVNRHPMNFPDWTHTNSVVYSPDDGDLIVSMRHQHWVIKVDYRDGAGTGNILWKLGWQGDFTLHNGTDPIDWQYAQHDPNVISTNSSGVFQMMMFDNGNNRVLDSSGDTCGSNTLCWSRVPIYQLDETAKTATIQWVDDLSPVFSSFGGNARLLASGDLEFDECAPTDLDNSAAIYEVSQTTPPQIVWQMQVTGQFAYRGFRMPSLYPGVQW
jgi:arylsulfate sulfotransferase